MPTAYEQHHANSLRDVNSLRATLCQQPMSHTMSTACEPHHANSLRDTPWQQPTSNAMSTAYEPHHDNILQATPCQQPQNTPCQQLTSHNTPTAYEPCHENSLQAMSCRQPTSHAIPTAHEPRHANRSYSVTKWDRCDRFFLICDFVHDMWWSEPSTYGIILARSFCQRRIAPQCCTRVMARCTVVM